MHNGIIVIYKLKITKHLVIIFVVLKLFNYKFCTNAYLLFIVENHKGEL